MTFLLQSNVFPLIENELRRSLVVTALAMNELPQVLKIGKTFPDKFSQACNTCWGKKADGYERPTIPVDDSGLEEPKAKRQKYDTGAHSTDDWSAPARSDYDWGSIAAAEGWGQGVEVTAGNSEWGNLSDWETDKPGNLFSLLGPTVLPLTHSPGIVERSMRRIVSITRPRSAAAKSLRIPLTDAAREPHTDAFEVEDELNRRFAKVALTPMIDWDGGEAPVYTKPAILATSQGAVVGRDGHHTPTSSTNSHPHNPEIDEITLLVDDIASDYLHEGMAIGATWVQLVRQGDAAAKKNNKPSCYWYLDEFALVVPSFWAIT